MATRLHKFEFYVINSSGLPVKNASVEVRRQGATVVSGGPTVFVVNNPGAIRHSGEVGTPASDSVTAYKADGTVRDASILGVSAVSATGITVAGPGFTGVADDDRLSPTTNLPTLYEDSEGAETKPNALTTNANGYAYCWAALAVCDALASGGDSPEGPITTRLLIDQAGSGGNIDVSNAWGSGSQVAGYFDTLRDLTTGDKLFSWRERGTERAYLDDTGKLFAAGLDVTGTLDADGAGSIGGLLTALAGLTLTGTFTMATAASKLVPGATSFTIRNNADSQDNFQIVNAGDATLFRDFTMRRIKGSRGTAHVAGDWALNANWGATASVTPNNANDTRGDIRIACAGAGTGANPTCTLTFKDGTYTTAPTAIVVPGGNTTVLTECDWIVSTSATQMIVTFSGTPTAGRNYNFFYYIIG